LRPTTGLLVGVLATLLRYPAAAAFHALFHMNGPALSFGMEALTAGVNGGGVALILLVFAQVRAREAAARAAAMAELRALQARMNPHFLFNALNAIAALSALNPKAVPAATARLGRFLRGSLEQHDRLTVPFREELAIVEAYLEIESLRFGKRLRVKTDLAADTQDVHVPPFLVQVLVENAVRHGIQPREEGGLVHVTARVEGPLLVVSVYDTGVGIAAEQLRQLRREAADGSHALTLLKRRLRGLYDDGFTLDIRSHPGKDTTVTVCVPLKSQLVIREVGAKHDSSRGRRGRAARPGVPVRAAGGHAEG
jgi:two-component system sensor histidine kinase LytS